MLSMDANRFIAIEDIYDNKKVAEVLDAYSSKYLLLPEEWKMRLRSKENQSYKTTKKIIKNALSDFYPEDILDSISSNIREMFLQEENPFEMLIENDHREKFLDKYIKMQGTILLEPLLRKFLSFPHAQLEYVYGRYWEFSEYPRTKELSNLYHKNMRDYSRIMKAKFDKNTQEWFESLLDVKNDRFIIQNVEHLYIRYLGLKDKNARFEVYCRYHHFFNSAEILPYLKKKFSRNSSYLQKMKFKDTDKKECLLHSNFHEYCPSTSQKEAPLNIYTTPPPRQQVFPFHDSLFYYIFKNASQQLTEKMYKSSKQLYLKIKKPLCHSLIIGSNLKLKYHCSCLTVNDYNFIGLNNLKIIHFLLVRSNSNETLLSNIILKLSSCHLNNLRIFGQNITVADYDFLTKAKKLLFISLYSCSIINTNGLPITIEHLLKQLPRCIVIRAPIEVTFTPFTPNTNQTLAQRKNLIKILDLFFNESCVHLDAIDFFNFFIRHTTTSSATSFTFSRKSEDAIYKRFPETFLNAYNDWKHEKSDDWRKFSVQFE